MNKQLNLLVIQSPFMKVSIGGTNFGGIEEYVSNFIICALSSGHKVTAILTSNGEVCPEVLNQENLTILKTEVPSKDCIIAPEGKKSRFNYGQMVNLINSLDFSEFDLVLNNSDKRTLNTTVARKSVGNVVTYLHNFPMWRSSHADSDRFLQFKNLGQVKYVANSQSNFHEWNKIVSKNFTTDDVLVDNINGLRISDPNINKILLDVDQSEFITVGRLVGWKRMITFAKMQEAIEGNFVIFGAKDEEPIYNALLKLESNNFSMALGVPKHEKYRRIIDTRPFMVNFADTETFGITLAESMAFGLPIIVRENGIGNSQYFIKNYPELYLDETSDYIISALGILVKSKLPGGDIGVAKAVKSALSTNIKFSSNVIRSHFEANYLMNEAHINHFIKTVTN